MAKTSCKKGQYYCNTDQKCKPIPDGYKVREDGILVSEGSLHKWFSGSKSKDGKGGWVNVPQVELVQVMNQVKEYQSAYLVLNMRV